MRIPARIGSRVHHHGTQGRFQNEDLQANTVACVATSSAMGPSGRAEGSPRHPGSGETHRRAVIAHLSQAAWRRAMGETPAQEGARVPMPTRLKSAAQQGPTKIAAARILRAEPQPPLAVLRPPPSECRRTKSQSTSKRDQERYGGTACSFDILFAHESAGTTISRRPSSVHPGLVVVLGHRSVRTDAEGTLFRFTPPAREHCRRTGRS